MDLEARVDELIEAARWSDVIALLAEHDAITRADSTLACTRGWAHYWLNELDAAEVWLRRAVERDGGSADAVFALGVVLHEAGKVLEAQRRLLAALNMRDSSIFRMGLAFFYLEQGRLDEAEAVHLEGLELRPRHPHLRAAYAAFLEDVGRHEDARAQVAEADEAFRDGIRARPESFLRIREYVTFLREEGRDDEAQAWERHLPEG